MPRDILSEQGVEWLQMRREVGQELAVVRQHPKVRLEG